MKKKLNKIPKFRNETEEANFWDKADITDYVSAGDFQRVAFPNLKSSSKTISLRMPESLLQALKVLANKQDVPYQSLIKVYLNQRVREEFNSGTEKR